MMPEIGAVRRYTVALMPMLIAVLTGVLALAGLVLGSLTVRDWNPIYDPDYLRDTVHQGVVAFLKLGLLLLLLCLGAVAVAVALLAHRDGTALPGGAWFSTATSWLLAIGFIVHWRRLRRARAARAVAAAGTATGSER